MRVVKILSLIAVFAILFSSCGNNTPEPIRPPVGENETCHLCEGHCVLLGTIVPVTCNNCNGKGMVSVKSIIGATKESVMGAFVRTSYKCKLRSCDCSGYWGYTRGNGTY